MSPERDGGRDGGGGGADQRVRERERGGGGGGRDKWGVGKREIIGF